MDVLSVLNTVNAFFWVGANVLLAYSAILLVVFLIAYVAVFDPRATTGGKLIFQFMLSLVGVILLSYIGVFVDPSPGRYWMDYPAADIADWRPVFRFATYGFVAYSVTMLVRLLIYRKWFPHKLKKASDLALVQPRHNTSEIPTVKAFVPEKKHAPKGGAGDSGASRR